MTEHMNVPKLRFDDYSDDWHVSTIGQLVKDNMLFKPLDGNHGNIHPKAKDYVDSGIPFLMASDIQNGQADLEGCKFIRKELADSLQKGFAQEGDVLLTHKGTVGETTLLEGITTPYVMLTPQVTYYRVKDSERLSNRFLQKMFVSSSFRKELLMKADSGTRPYIGIMEQLTLNLTYPQYNEQQKIASFLSKVDEKISLLSEKKDKLTEYKKGVMQQLFNGKWENQDGQLIFIPPTLRFKADDGSEFPDWEKKKLGDLTTSIKSGKSKASEHGAIDLWGSTGKIGVTDQASHNGHFILVARVGANAGKINEVCGKFGVSDNTLVIDVKSNHSLRYIKYSLLKFDLNRLIFGSGQPLITGGDLKAHAMVMPSFEEQTVIANFLSAIDQKIDLTNTELEKAKEWKKGLLQQMFV